MGECGREAACDGLRASFLWATASFSSKYAALASETATTTSMEYTSSMPRSPLIDGYNCLYFLRSLLPMASAFRICSASDCSSLSA